MQVIVNDAAENGVESRIEIDQSRLERIELTSCIFKNSSIFDSVFEACLLFGSNLDGARVKRTRFNGGVYSGMIMSGAKLEDVCFEGCKLNLANFRGSTLKRVTFRDCDLSEVDFGGAILSMVTFDKCTMAQTEFNNCTILSADLRASEISNIKGVSGLKGASIDSSQLISLAQSMAVSIGLVIDEDAGAETSSA